MPMLTQRPWFGPRRFGWGWTPYSWHGWVVTAVFLAGIILGEVFLHGTLKLGVVIALFVLYLAICVFTGERPGHRA
jgi:hypothetical protein